MDVLYVRRLLLLACVLIELANGEFPETYKMEDNCGGTITFSNSMLLTSESIQDPTCYFDIQADNTANQLMLQVTKIDLLDSCNATSIEFEDEFGKRISGKLCQSQGGKYTSHNNVVKATYDSQNPKTPGRKISVLVTSYHQSPCFQEEFKCSNSMCISSTLACNGYNECSDGSDEGSVCNASNITPGNVGIILLMCIVSKLFIKN